MPSRKKSSLSQYSRNARRMRAIRSRESDEDREARLAAARERQATARSLETSTQRESRLCAQRIRTAASRALESSKEREARRTADRERHTLSRALETLTERESRLSSQLVRTAFSRLFESSEEREARRTADRQRHAESRAFETFTRRKRHLSADRDRHDIARAVESEDRYRRRLESARENYERTRQDREDFLLLERERIDEMWQPETAEQRQARLRHSLDIISISSQDSDEAQEDGAVKYELPWIVKDYVLQPDGSVTPVAKVQNLVLDEQRAGEILSLAQALREQQSLSKPTASPGTTLLSSAQSLPGSTSAMLRLQFCSAQAIADGSASTTVRKTKLLPSLLPSEPIRLENGITTLNLLPAVEHADLGKHAGEEVLIIHPYECSECNLLFSTPEDFLHHQGEHFLAQDKESGGTGVMLGYEDGTRAKDDEGRKGDAREEGSKAEQGKGQGARRSYTARLAGLGVTSSISSVNLRCEECKRTFTTANRLAAHLRVHEQGTHECPECDKVFKKVGSLHTHMRTHSGEARFLCVDCGHSFTTEMTLIIHRKSHTSEPLHRCPFCAKTFTNMTKFLYHRRTHTNREPVSAASTVPLTQRMPLSIMQRAREREAVWRKQKRAALSAPETDTGESILEAAASLSQAAAMVENGVDSKDPTTEDAQATLDNSLNTDVMNDSDEWQAPITEEDIKFPCATCSKSFTSRIRLLSHRRSAHSSERRFKCNVCGKPFKKQIHLRNHLRTHTGERPFQCSVCGKTFSSLANLTRHGLTHTGVRPYRCDVCHRAFTQSSNLRQHRLLHSNPTPSACPDCSATFIRPSKLIAHRFLNHPGAPAPYSCPHCPKGFLRKKQRDLHCLEEHPNLTHPFTDSVNDSGNKGQVSVEGVEQAVPLVQKPNLDCTICGKRLNSMANLRLHQLSHGLGPGRPRGSGSASGKSHPCPVCGKLFVSASSVTLHQRVHTGERPYPCAVCGKRFRQNTHLREHLRTHSGERPFRCEFCNKGFVQSMHLVEHRRTHTGERPHTCAECGKTFKTISNLRNHRKTHNKAQQETEQGTDADLETTTVESGLATLAVVNSTDGNFCSQPQLIQIQTSDLEQTQGTPTIMCNEFGEAIAIIETSGDLAEAIELYHTALEGGINMDTITLDNLQLM